MSALRERLLSCSQELALCLTALQPPPSERLINDAAVLLRGAAAALELEGVDSARLDWLESRTRIWPADEQEPISVGISEHVWPRASLRQAIDSARAGT